MFKRKPALKFHAVMSRVKMRSAFSLWEVTDRRSNSSNSLLLVPNGLIAWPILYSRTVSLHPRPVRLRNNKVALLFQGVSAVELLSSLKKSGYKYHLDPNTGFQQVDRGLFRISWLATPVALAAIVVSVGMPPNVKNTAVKEPTTTCSAIPYPVEISSKQTKSKKFQIKDESFRFSLKPALGGLYEVRIRRGCDHKLFTGKAWLTKDGLAISKLN